MFVCVLFLSLFPPVCLEGCLLVPLSVSVCLRADFSNTMQGLDNEIEDSCCIRRELDNAVQDV